MKTFDITIKKKSTFFMFKQDLTCYTKTTFFSPSNRFLDSNSGILGEVGTTYKSVKCLKYVIF